VVITIEDLIRRSGREPGGGLPKGYAETWTFSNGKRYARHTWEPFASVPLWEPCYGIAVRDPKAVERIANIERPGAGTFKPRELIRLLKKLPRLKAVERIHPFSLVDIAKRRNPHPCI
jgi:hypothetical protein